MTVAEFSQKCTDHYLGHHADEKAMVAIDPVTILLLVGEIITLIVKNCPVNRTAQVAKSIKEPSLGQRIKYRAHVAHRCDCCSEPSLRTASGGIADCIQHCAKELTDEEIASVVADAVNPDFLLV